MASEYQSNERAAWRAPKQTDSAKGRANAVCLVSSGPRALTFKLNHRNGCPYPVTWYQKYAKKIRPGPPRVGPGAVADSRLVGRRFLLLKLCRTKSVSRLANGYRAACHFCSPNRMFTDLTDGRSAEHRRFSRVLLKCCAESVPQIESVFW